MYRIFILFIISVYVISCSPKLATKTTEEDFDEDLSSFRPSIVVDETESIVTEPETIKGPFVAATHDINDEMSVALDSIIFYNRENRNNGTLSFSRTGRSYN